MKIKKMAVALALAIPFAAHADIDYSFAELDDTTQSTDGVDKDATGGSLRGAVAFNGTWYGVLNYSDLLLDLGATDMDIIRWNVGVGARMQLATELDLLGELTYEKAKSEVGATSISDTGHGLKVGLRGMATDALELNGHARRVDMDETETLFSVGAAWEFADSWSLVFDFETGDDVDLINFGIRYGF